MNRRTLFTMALFAALVALTGCKPSISPDSSEEVDVTGTVTNASGTPVQAVSLQFQPVGGTARQASFNLGADGKFAGKMTAGKYTYFFAEIDGKPAPFTKIPAGHKAGSMDRTIEVKKGEPINIKVQ